MSYNIDSIEYLSGTGPLLIEQATRKRLAEELDTPDGCFLTDDFGTKSSIDLPGWLKLERVSWRSEGSGSTYYNLLTALSHTMGTADLLVTWERGDSFTGIRVVNGKVTQHEVTQALGEEVVK